MISRDGGRTWGPAPLQNADVMALGIAPTHRQIMYAAGHDVFVKSTDSGQTWSPVAHNLPGADIHGFGVDPDDAEKAYAHVVGQAGLLVSEDGGLTWKPMPGAMPATTYNLAIGENAQTLYAAAGQAGVWRSAGGGRTWAQLSSAPGGAVALAYNRTNQRLLITTLDDEAGLYASDDGGGSWKSLGLKGMLMAVASSPIDPDHLIAVDEEGWVYASQDGGLTWPN